MDLEDKAQQIRSKGRKPVMVAEVSPVNRAWLTTVRVAISIIVAQLLVDVGPALTNFINEWDFSQEAWKPIFQAALRTVIAMGVGWSIKFQSAKQDEKLDQEQE